MGRKAVDGVEGWRGGTGKSAGYGGSWGIGGDGGRRWRVENVKKEGNDRVIIFTTGPRVKLASLIKA
jgi:hypothetical protein